jgi:hypothetical protein
MNANIRIKTSFPHISADYRNYHMKNLVNDVLSIFSETTPTPILVRPDLSKQDKESIKPIGVITVDWATSIMELNEAILHKTNAIGAVGYHITRVDSHKTGVDKQSFISATVTLYSIPQKKSIL